MIKEQYFGVEVEMTGLTKRDAATVLANFFDSEARYVGGGYSTWEVKDQQNRTWKVMNDGSIRAQKKENGQIIDTGSDYVVELVTPKLAYSDIETLQEIIRKLRKAKAFVNSSCGIHIHVDAANHNAKSLRNLINIMASKEDILYKALKIESYRESQFCKKVNQRMLKQLNIQKPATKEDLANIWYREHSNRTNHYNETRYHGLNLHSVWYRGTVEFRLFNSTLHAGEIKAYIQFCLAVSAQALTQRSASPARTTSTNEKFTFRTWLLRLGLIGDEFKTARLHLLKNLEGNSAFRYASGN